MGQQFIKSVSPHDPVMKPVMDEFGFEGYGRFIAVLDFCRHYKLETVDVEMIVKQANSNKRGATKLLPLFQECLTNVLVMFGEAKKVPNSLPTQKENIDQSLPKLEGQNPRGSIKEREEKSRSRIEKNINNSPTSSGLLSVVSRCDADKPITLGLPDIQTDKETEFIAWYQKYPRHVSRANARAAYSKARKKASAEVLLNGIDRYLVNKPSYADWMYPATWLNGECWEDGDYKPGYSTKPASIIKPSGTNVPANYILQADKRVEGLIEL